MYQTLKTDDICIKQNLLFIISYYFYIFFYREIWSGSESFPSPEWQSHLPPQDFRGGNSGKTSFFYTALVAWFYSNIAGGMEPVVQGGTVWRRNREILWGSDQARESWVTDIHFVLFVSRMMSLSSILAHNLIVIKSNAIR